MTNCPKCNVLFEEKNKWGIKKFCSRTCANSRTKSQSEKDAVSLALSGRKGPASPQKGKELKDREIRVCNECNSEFKCLPSYHSHYCSKDCSKSHLGGYRAGSGRSKSGYYKGIYCGSTYELAWVIYRLDHDLPVIRFNGYIIYNNNRKYYPDFLDSKHIYEMKGWLCEKTDPEVISKSVAAMNAGYTIDVLFKEDLQKEFDWVKTNYSTSKFYTLYDRYKPIFTYVCGNPKCKKEFGKDKKSKTEINYCCQFCAGQGQQNRNKKSL